MEDGVSQGSLVGDPAAAPRSPPPPPEPTNNESVPNLTTTSPSSAQSDQPLVLANEQWDITSISAIAAVQMLADALSSLAEATGDIPPTPPVSRPTTPHHEADKTFRTGSSSSSDPRVPPITIGSPEAHPHEPITVIGANAEDVARQHAAIARRFFSKVPPAFSLSDYLLRLHKWCPHSAGVYLAAATYCHRLCVADLMVPATTRTVHRLALAAIRVAAKALEDNKWTQGRMIKVGGVSGMQMMNLEVTLCFLLDFDLWVDEVVLTRSMFLLQQAARHGAGLRGGTLSEQFRLKMPGRMRLRRDVAVEG